MDTEYMRRKTVLVIKKDRQYLSRVEMLTRCVIWSPHLADAWSTREIGKARFLSEKFDAQIMMFNPIVWEVRTL